MRMRSMIFMVFLLVCAINLQSQTKVIANWDMIPRQIINTATKVGVVAFHESGVNVTFTINGGSPLTVTAPTHNDQSKVWEYWITIDPAQYPDGQITISATAYPENNADSAKQLPDLILYANSKGTLTNSKVVWADAVNGNDTAGDGTTATPYKSIEKAYRNVGQGGIVILKAGTYVLPPDFYPPTNYNYWTTITRDKNGTAPNLGDVKINGTQDPQVRSSMFKFDGISFFKNSPDYSNSTTPPFTAMLDINVAGMYTWFNNCEFYDVYGKNNNESFLFTGNSNNPYYYLTDCHIHDIAYSQTWWERGTIYKNIGVTIWWAKTNSFYVNVTVDSLGTSANNPNHPHSDLILYISPKNPIDNLIMYNVNVKMNNMCMGFMSGDNTPITNNAIVNLFMQMPELRPDVGSQIWNFDHLLLWHNTIENFPLLFRLDTAAAFIGWNKNSDIRDNIFFRVSGLINNSYIDRNHYNMLAWDQATPLGTNATVGKPYFVDSTSAPLGYHLQDVSPAYRKGVALECVPADIDGILFEGQTPSLGAFSSLAITVVSPSIPREFTVSQNYPNPFNPSTKIDFFVAAKVNIKLVIYDLLGRQIRTLVDGIVAAGPQSVSWDGRDTQGTTVSSGVYFYCVEHRSQRLAKQMMLIK